MHQHIHPHGTPAWLRMLLGGLLLTAGVAGSAAVAPVGPAWIASYDSPSRFNEGSDIAVDSAGNAYVVGPSVPDRVTGDANLAVVKYSTAGKRLWARTYVVPGGLGGPVRAALDGDEAIVVAGTSDDDITNLDLLVVKYDSAGDLDWDFSFNSTNNGNDLPGDIAVDAAGDVYVSGIGDSLGVFSTDALTFKLSGGGGGILWQDRIVGETTDSHSISEILVDDAAGSLYVTGRVADQIDERDAGSFFTRRFALSSGAVQWDAVYDGPGLGSDAAAALALTPEHDLVVTGRSVGLDDTADFTTIKYDTTDGTQLWVRRYSGPQAGADEAVSVAVDPNGIVYVTGASQGTAARAIDFATVAYDGTTGNQLWVARYDGVGGENVEDGFFDLPAEIGVDANGNATVTGRVSIGNERFAIATVQYSPTGRQQWIHVYSGPGRNDIGSALALDSFGSIYIVGTSVTNNFADDRSIRTLKYLANGRRPAAKPTFTFSESSRDRLACRREMGSQVCEEVTGRTFKIASTATMEGVDISTFGPTTPLALEVGGFQFDATLADDPRYRAGRTSATFTETVLDEDNRERKALTVTLNWAGGKLRVAVVGTAFATQGILASDFVDDPTGSITDTATSTVSLGSFSQAFDVEVTGRVTTREVQQGAFTLSTVTLTGKGVLP